MDKTEDTPFRDKPSDRPYRATRWSDALSHFWNNHARKLVGALLVALLVGGITWLDGAIHRQEQWRYNLDFYYLKCETACNPDGWSARLNRGWCRCTPRNAPAYEPKGDWTRKANTR